MSQKKYKTLDELVTDLPKYEAYQKLKNVANSGKLDYNLNIKNTILSKQFEDVFFKTDSEISDLIQEKIMPELRVSTCFNLAAKMIELQAIMDSDSDELFNPNRERSEGNIDETPSSIITSGGYAENSPSRNSHGTRHVRLHIQESPFKEEKKIIPKRPPTPSAKKLRLTPAARQLISELNAANRVEKQALLIIDNREPEKERQYPLDTASDNITILERYFPAAHTYYSNLFRDGRVESEDINDFFRLNSFASLDMIRYLKDGEYNHVVIAGFNAPTSIQGHVRTLIEEGFKVRIVKDAIAGPIIDDVKSNVCFLNSMKFLPVEIYVASDFI